MKNKVTTGAVFAVMVAETLVLLAGDGVARAGIDPSSLAVGKFRGAGMPDDLAVVTGFWGRTMVLLGRGDGTFVLRVSYQAPFPISVAVGDFNGDGYPDLAVVDEFLSFSVEVLLGNGDGTFQDARYFPIAGSQSWYVAAGDFNGDGYPDLAVSHCCPDGISVLLGNGDGTFQSPQNYQVSNTAFVAVGDINGDGIPDLATPTSVLLGNGDGTFQEERVFGDSSRTPLSVAVGDFNGDGVQDLAVANWETDNVSVLLGNGDGTFQEPRYFDVGSRPWSVAVGDFDGDGRQDLAVANWETDNVSVLLGNGDGTFQEARNFDTGRFSGPSSVVVGDFNADGIPDLAAAWAGGAYASVLLGNGDGTFQPAQRYGGAAPP